MDVDEHAKQKTEATTQGTEDTTQILADETSSAVPKTTSNADHDAKAVTAVDSNERDIKAAAASALAAAAVKAKVRLLDTDRQSYVLLSSSISRRSKNARLNRLLPKWWRCKSRSWKSNCDISKNSKRLWIANARCSKFNGSNFCKNDNNFS